MYMHLFYVLGNASTAAGNWGDYKCDVPYQTLENLMEFLGNMSDEVGAEIKGHCSKIDLVVSFLFQFDWVYWTGDLPPHNVWNQSRENQVRRVSKWWQELHIQVQLRIFLLVS